MVTLLVEHTEKNLDLTAKELAGNFTAKFGRPKPADAIVRILQRKEEIRQEFASWAAKFQLELEEAACRPKPDEKQKSSSTKTTKSFSFLTTAQKDWIVEYGEKNPDMSLRRIAQNFTLEFHRPCRNGTIHRILKERNVRRKAGQQKFVPSNPPRENEVGKKSEESSQKSLPIILLPISSANGP